jgi:DNA-binding transcriptional ArsR family regulator
MEQTNEERRLRLRTVGFLAWLIQAYGYTVKGTYRKIAKKNGYISYCTVRLLLIELQEFGIVTVNREDKKRPVYKIDKQKAKQYV